MLMIKSSPSSTSFDFCLIDQFFEKFLEITLDST